MPQLLDRIRLAVRQDRYLISNHADDRLRERSIMHWQIVSGLDSCVVIRERPLNEPDPLAEVEQLLADGTAVKAVWAYVSAIDCAKLVTVHFLDR